MTHQGHVDDFDIGKAIFDQLRELPAERQQRVLRWVAEALGVPGVSVPGPLLRAPSGNESPKQFDSAPTTSVVATDIKSFITAKAPKSDQQFAAAVAYYYRFEAPPAERKDSISGEVLQESARLAGRKRFSNPRATLNNAKKAGYLDGGAPGEFAVNSVGENLVAMTLPGGGDTSGNAAKPRKRTKPAKSPAPANKSRKGLTKKR